MVIITTNTSNERDYNLNATLEEEIKQNVINIVTRIQGNVPLNREKGIYSEYIDNPSEEVKQLIIADLIEELEREEPRFEVEDIELLEKDLGAIINVKITGYIKEEDV